MTTWVSSSLVAEVKFARRFSKPLLRELNISGASMLAKRQKVQAG